MNLAYSSSVRYITVFLFEGVTLSLTAMMGIIGNVLTCVVLHRISLDNVFNQVRQRFPFFY